MKRRNKPRLSHRSAFEKLETYLRVAYVIFKLIEILVLLSRL